MIKDDGDIIRGLGFVTMYSAWVEESVDGILCQLSRVRAFDKRIQRWPISKKLERAAQTVEQLQSKMVQELPALLRNSVVLFEERNEVIHGRIYAGHAKKTYLRSGRPNVPTREVTSAELYALANNFANCHVNLLARQAIKLPAAITSSSPSR